MHQTGLYEAVSRGARPRRKVEAAFSGVLFELISRGGGLGWLPHSMCRKGLASGDLDSLEDAYGSIPMEITLFALDTQGHAMDLLHEI